jgi:hypothetical protein
MAKLSSNRIFTIYQEYIATICRVICGTSHIVVTRKDNPKQVVVKFLVVSEIDLFLVFNGANPQKQGLELFNPPNTRLSEFDFL